MADKPYSLLDPEPLPEPIGTPAAAPTTGPKPSTARNGLPNFWVTGIAKALVGDQPCLRQTWLKGHFNLPKLGGAHFAEWKIRHTDLLTKIIDEMRAAGWGLKVEKYMRLTGTTGIMAGKPDIIATGKDIRPKIVDAKGGDPRDSDTAQVLIYMVMVPLVWRMPELQFDGEVIYPTHRVPIAHGESVKMREPMFAMLRRLSKPERPEAAPSENNCKFCEATLADCPDRIVDAAPDILTSEF